MTAAVDAPTALALPDAASVMARAGGENFAVASALLGRAAARDLLAIYGFARLVDELGDAVEGDRLAHLDLLETELDAVYEGRPQHELLRRLQATVRAHDLPRDPFARLLEANRRDQRQATYETFADLRSYCHLSADPVGELVLGIFGAATSERVALSDDVCTALQLAEHWQDVGEDARAGRVYLPAEERIRFGVTHEHLLEPHAAPPLRELLAFEVERARTLLDRGAALVGTLRGRARIAVAGYVAGGRAALDAVEAADYDVLPGAPRPAGRRRAALALRTLVAGR